MNQSHNYFYTAIHILIMIYIYIYIFHLAHSPSLLLGQGHRPFYLVQAHNEEVPRDCVLLNE